MENTHGSTKPTNTETIRKMDGKPIATIRTNTETGEQRGYDNRGNYVGRFDPKSKTTYDNKNRPVSKGNGLVGVATNSLCHKGMGAVCHPVAVVESSYRPRNVSRPIPVNSSASPRPPYRPVPAVPSSYYPRGPRWR